MPSPAALIDVLGLESLDQATAPTFAEILQRLWEARFQGSVTLYFAGGVPRAIEVSQPVQVTLGRETPLTGR